MIELSDTFIFWAVILGRFFIPLVIFRYPLPGVIAALVLDGVDQTIFQQFTSLNLENYQSYDKALDIYYLTLAYISTLRNWTNLHAVKVGRFLWYYRLVGVTLFELTYTGEGPRWLMLIFPNVFEYFFIFYESVNLRWNPLRLSKKAVLKAAAFIWIFIKLPQEYWIHIAQLDTTDFLKKHVFHVPLDAGLQEILAANQWLIPTVLVATVVIIVGLRAALKKLPPADWQLTVNADEHTKNSKNGRNKPDYAAPSVKKLFLNTALLEKTALVSLVCIIFAQILPGVQVTNLGLMLGAGAIIMINALFSQWLINKGKDWSSVVGHFSGMVVVNFGLVLFYAYLLLTLGGVINLGNTLFFVLLLTLIVTLFDRYRKVYEERFVV